MKRKHDDDSSYEIPPGLSFDELLAELPSSWGQDKVDPPPDNDKKLVSIPTTVARLYTEPSNSRKRRAYEFVTCVNGRVVYSPRVPFRDRGKKNHLRISGVKEKNAVLLIKKKHWNGGCPVIDYYVNAFKTLMDTNPDASNEYQAVSIHTALIQGQFDVVPGKEGRDSRRSLR